METEEILAAIQKAAETIATPNCAAWFSAVAAAIAVVVAIIVAIMQYRIYKKQNKIAEEQTVISKKQNEIAESQAEIARQQNRITLFEKRYNVYCEFQKIFYVYEEVNDDKLNYDKIDDRILVLNCIETIYGIDFKLEDETKHIPFKSFIYLLTQCSKSRYQIKQVTFLFSNVQENEVNDLLNAWESYISSLPNTNENVDRFAKKFIKSCGYFKNKYAKAMEEQMNLEQGD